MQTSLASTETPPQRRVPEPASATTAHARSADAAGKGSAGSAASALPQPWVSLVARNQAARRRLSQLAQALDQTVIPRLAENHREGVREPLHLAHRPSGTLCPMSTTQREPGHDLPLGVEAQGSPPMVVEDPRACAAAGNPASARAASIRASGADVEALLAHVRAHQHEEATWLVQRLRERGLSVDGVCLDVLGPVACRLGELWEEDRCDFATVTMAMGTVQRLLRELGTAFVPAMAEDTGAERSVLFTQAPDEQHSFGLSVLADFFRRAGWDVHGGVGGAVADPAAAVRRTRFDLVGLSVGSEVHLPWARRAIAEIRRGSRNPHLCILVGGPLFVTGGADPRSLGADGHAADAPAALALADRLLAGATAAAGVGGSAAAG